MTTLLIIGIIFLVLLLVIIIIIANFIMQMKQKVETVSSSILGTKSVIDGLQNIQKDYEATPKTVAGSASLYLPRIMTDFPDFHYDEMNERAKQVLLSYLLSIHERKDNLPDYVNSDLKNQLQLHLQMLANNQQKESFSSMKIHDCQLNWYAKEKGKCKITFQAAIGYYHFTKDNQGKLISGSETNTEQSKYNIHMLYIQDRDVVEIAQTDGLGLNCPNCGAAITNLGEKFCEYCGSGIITLNINTWTFSTIEII